MLKQGKKLYQLQTSCLPLPEPPLPQSDEPQVSPLWKVSPPLVGTHPKDTGQLHFESALAPPCKSSSCAVGFLGSKCRREELGFQVGHCPRPWCLRNPIVKKQDVNTRIVPKMPIIKLKKLAQYPRSSHPREREQEQNPRKTHQNTLYGGRGVMRGRRSQGIPGDGLNDVERTQGVVGLLFPYKIERPQAEQKDLQMVEERGDALVVLLRPE